MKIKGSEIICRLLERQGITTIAGIPGGANLPLYDALHDSPIRHVLARHEQGAGFIAQGMARVTGRTAVCLGTSGPGATNLVTAIADAKLDSIPLVVITGQVPTTLIGTDAFQEVDTFGMTMPITKHNFLVEHPEELLEIIPAAFHIAESGRPGPVLIDVPKDVQMKAIEVSELPVPLPRALPADCPADAIHRLAQMIAPAKRPVIYIGGGVIHAHAGQLARELAYRIDAPVTATLMGLGAIPADDPHYLGMLGMHAARSTNYILDEADLLIAIGARFDDRATGKVAEFCKHAHIAHIDIDRAEIDKIKQTNLSIVGDARRALEQLLPELAAQTRPEWMQRVAELKSAHPLAVPSDDPLYPVNLCRTLGSVLEPDTIITTDVGQHQMWVAQAYPFRQPRTLLTSGGLGTMGFGLPAAIGAALAAPDRRVICVSGDGSLLMNIQELATLAELDLDVTVVLMNNAHLGLVRQQQELFYNQRYHASKFHIEPDFVGIARSFGVKGCDLEKATDPVHTLMLALAERGPTLINVPIHFAENVLPMVPPGAANREMLDHGRMSVTARA